MAVSNRDVERFVDQTKFLIAVQIYSSWGGKVPNSHVKRIAEPYNLIAEELIHPLEDRDIPGVKMAVNKAQRATGRDAQVAANAELMATLIPVFIRRTDLLGEMFPGRAGQSLRHLNSALSEDDPVARMAQVVNIPMITGQNVLKDWMLKAADNMGVVINESEIELSEATAAVAIGESLKENDKEILIAEPNSEAAVQALAQKDLLLSEREEMADMARDAERFKLISAAASVADNHTNVTKTGARLKLNANQERAMMAKGKTLIAAGAGSGKCVRGDTLIQTEQGFVRIEELCEGLNPEEDRPLVMTIHGVNGPEKTSHVYCDGEGPTIRFVTFHGFELEATPNHKIHVERGSEIQWVRMADLRVGDKVVLDQRRGLFYEGPHPLSVEDAYALGQRLDLGPEIFGAPVHLVQSWFDGAIEQANCALGHITWSKESRSGLFRDMQTLLLALGIKASRRAGRLSYNHAQSNEGKWTTSPVEVIEDGLTAKTYDFVVPGTHSFTGNGFVNHNTRVLAAKVVYEIQERGIPEENILAISFTRKAAAELRHRIEAYGVPGASKNKRNFTTLNSLGAQLARDAGLGGGQMISSYEESQIVRMAMKQVALKPPGRMPPPDRTQGLLGPEPGSGRTLAPTPPSKAQPQPPQAQAPVVGPTPQTDPYLGALKAAEDWHSRFNTDPEWGPKTVKFLKDLQDKYTRFGVDASRLTDKQLAWLKKIFARAKVTHKLASSSQHDVNDPSFDWNAAAHYFRALTSVSQEQESIAFNAALKDHLAKTAGPDDDKRDNTPPMSPANMWFNLGWDAMFETGSKDGKVTTEDVSPAAAKRFIDQALGAVKSPAKLFYANIDGVKTNPQPPGKAQPAPSMEAYCTAVYGAFLWIKDNHVNFKGRMTFNDQLIVSTRELRLNPSFRKKIQSRFRVVLKDEAQDSNRANHLMVGLIAGTIDPDTLEDYADNRINAETYCLIGDDKQCLDENSIISTPYGETKVLKDIKPGDKVLSYRRGEIVAQTVRHAQISGWTQGLKVTFESGKTLLMSPNHKLWASTPHLNEGEVLVYLMHKEGMGFRVGVTAKGGQKKRGQSYLDSLGGRAFMEQADRMWVLGIYPDRETALLEETRVSLTYGVPTSCFNGKHRGLNQERLNTIFQSFGENGERVLEDRHLSFALPHWNSQSYSKHGRSRHTLHLLAHTSQGTQVSMEWEGSGLDHAFSEVPPSSKGNAFEVLPSGRRRFRRWMDNYREALALAEHLAQKTGAILSQRMSLPEGPLNKMTASGLYPGMVVPVLESDTLVLDTITSIEPNQPGRFIDLDVDDASNFIANGVLTSNSIYAFRGAAPNEFVDRSNLSDKKGGFQTLLLETNYRSGGLIVGAANNLIAHNVIEDPENGKLVNLQIPMVCNVKAASEGGGTIRAIKPHKTKDAWVYAADYIKNLLDSGAEDLGDDADHPTFGICVRTNKELGGFALELIKREIPFRMKQAFNPLTKDTIRDPIGVFTVASPEATPQEKNAAISGMIESFLKYAGRRYVEVMQANAKGDYLSWFLNEEYKHYPRIVKKNSDEFKVFLERILALGDKKPSELLVEMLDWPIPGEEGKTFKEVAIKKIRDNDKIMERLTEDHMDEHGNVSEEAILGEALASVHLVRDLTENFASTSHFLNYYKKLLAANAKAAKDEDGSGSDRSPAVMLDTIHQWKGLEAKYIFCPMTEGKFPHAKSADDPYALAEERRLAYVAITRAAEVFIALCPQFEDEPLSEGPPRRLAPSSFVYEACIPIAGEEPRDLPAPPGGQKTAMTEEEIYWFHKL